MRFFARLAEATWFESCEEPGEALSMRNDSRSEPEIIALVMCEEYEPPVFLRNFYKNITLYTLKAGCIL